MQKFSTKNILTKKNIFDRLSSYSIFSSYCENFGKLGKSFISDLPGRAKKDTSPSCQIEYIGGDLLYTDFGERSYRVLDYVQRKFGLTYRETLRKINVDFNLNLIDSDITPIKGGICKVKNINTRPIKREKTTSIIKVKYANLNEKDTDYWKEYGWTKEMLKKASIMPIEYFWITMIHKNIIDMPFYVGKELAYSFDYYNHNNIFRRKLYFPERLKERRFISNVDDTIIQNWPNLPKNGGDTLFITKSLKDCGPFMRLGFYAISPNNEKVFLPEEIFYKKIKTRWKNIILWWDNDETGLKFGSQFGNRYGLKVIFNPTNAPKDPSDYWKEYGGREFNYLLNSLVDGK